MLELVGSGPLNGYRAMEQESREMGLWERLLTLSLAQEEDNVEGKSPDPFHALANGELIAEAIAHNLDP